MNRSLLLLLFVSSFAIGERLAAAAPPAMFSSREVAIEAYVGSCTASPPAAPEEAPSEGSGGTRFTYDCDPASDACVARAFESHGNCQAKCAGQCGDCRETCPQGDDACIRACAVSRADCGGICDVGTIEDAEVHCMEAFNECLHANTTRLRACDWVAGRAFGACVGESDDSSAARAEARCAKKFPKLDAWCRKPWTITPNVEEFMTKTQPRVFPEATQLAEKCTAEAQCPAEYAHVAPYLGAFCAGALGQTSLDSLRDSVNSGQISKRALSVVFNALGAMHSYQFKKETWLQGFFYGSGEWLPASCRAVIGTLRGPGEVPLAVTRLRDQVKKIWAQAR